MIGHRHLGEHLYLSVIGNVSRVPHLLDVKWRVNFISFYLTKPSQSPHGSLHAMKLETKLDKRKTGTQNLHKVSEVWETFASTENAQQRLYEYS